jgi:hypothetical protein
MTAMSAQSASATAAETTRPTVSHVADPVPVRLPGSQRTYELREEHYLRDVRARVKHARAVASKMPGLAAILRERPERAARFYARFGIKEEQFRSGVPIGLDLGA